MSLLAALVFGLYRFRANQRGKTMKLSREGRLLEYIGKDSSELKIYDFDSILIATDSFSIKNKLGQGGFGPVYKVLFFPDHILILHFNMYKIYTGGNGSTYCFVEFIRECYPTGRK